MTIRDLDMWRAADLLIEQHGENAQRVVIRRMKEMNEQNDFGGAITWGRIREAVARLQAKQNEPTH